MSDPAPWLLLVAAAHLGFQVTVAAVVYPALAEVPLERWTGAHERHSRRIAPLVLVLYPALLGVVGWSLLARPDQLGAWVAASGAAVTLAATVLLAAPTHGALGATTPGRHARLVRRLLVADRVRTLGALVLAAGALAVALA